MKSRHILTTLAVLAIVICTIPPVMAAADATQDAATNYFNLGQIAIERGQLAVAVEDFDKALAENTTMLSSGDGLMYLYQDKTAVLTDLGRYDDALKTVNAGLIQFRNSTGMWNNKGYVLYQMGRYNEAIDAYTQAVTIDPSYLKGWINRGNALVKAGRSLEAADSFNKALALDPGNTDATNGLAEAQNAALPMMTIIIIIVVIAVAGIVVWYVKFRSPGTKGKSEKKGDGDKK